MSAFDITVIDSGKVRLEYGPISMVLCAWADGKPLDALLKDSCGYAASCLNELSEQLPLLRKPWTLTKVTDFYGIGTALRRSVEKTGDKTFTPMAAVAGTMSDFAADFLQKNGATKVIVNNGGDIALRMKADDIIKVGVIPSINTGDMSSVVEIKGTDGIFGICTSGLGGRSFTRGVADAVTVLGKSCSVADAYATFLANETYISSPNVKRIKARFLDPNSDIGELEVTTSVGTLTEKEIDKAISQLKGAAWKGIDTGHIERVYGCIQGREVVLTRENLHGN